MEVLPASSKSMVIPSGKSSRFSSTISPGTSMSMSGSFSTSTISQQPSKPTVYIRTVVVTYLQTPSMTPAQGGKSGLHLSPSVLVAACFIGTLMLMIIASLIFFFFLGRYRHDYEDISFIEDVMNNSRIAAMQSQPLMDGTGKRPEYDGPEYIPLSPYRDCQYSSSLSLGSYPSSPSSMLGSAYPTRPAPSTFRARAHYPSKSHSLYDTSIESSHSDGQLLAHHHDSCSSCILPHPGVPFPAVHPRDPSMSSSRGQSYCSTTVGSRRSFQVPPHLMHPVSCIVPVHTSHLSSSRGLYDPLVDHGITSDTRYTIPLPVAHQRSTTSCHASPYEHVPEPKGRSVSFVSTLDSRSSLPLRPRTSSSPAMPAQLRAPES